MKKLNIYEKKYPGSTCTYGLEFSFTLNLNETRIKRGQKKYDF